MEILPPKKIKLVDIPDKGRGIIATQDILAGQIIEICPIIILSQKDTDYIRQSSDFLNFYYLEQTAINKACLMLGYGSLYNHNSKDPNADIDYDTDEIKNYVIFKALEDIKAGQEITYNYDYDSDKIEFLKID
ncbi:MAG: SET domain-containing protein-lysine N-methyltransferase [Candidatus Buchananbacteria bacterium]